MKVLMVCLGNICRSPIAQGILEDKIVKWNLDWTVDSAGTSGWHDGELPDKRAIEVSQKHGIDLTSQKSRKLTKKDIYEYDLILAMDSSNYQDIIRLCENDLQKNKVNLIMNFKYPNSNLAVPDPYYDNRFNEVFELLDDAIEEIIKN